MEVVSSKEQPPAIRNIEKIQEICSNLVTEVTHINPGINQEDLNWLENGRRDFRTLRSFYNTQRKRGRIPKKRSHELAEKGLSPDLVTEDETIIASELLDALHATYTYIDATDPKKAREKERGLDIDYVNSAVKANIEFADFFIKIHQRFNLTGEEMYQTFDLLFEKAGLNRELEARGLENFPGGVLAVMRAYLHLCVQLPDWQIRVPAVMLDRDHSVDLIAEKGIDEEKETRFFEIKGRLNTKDVEMSEITEERDMENVRKRIVLNTKDNQDKNIKLSSLYKLFSFTKHQRQKGLRVKAYWVEVPSAV